MKILKREELPYNPYNSTIRKLPKGFLWVETLTHKDKCTMIYSSQIMEDGRNPSVHP